jgi:hypothetical protein
VTETPRGSVDLLGVALNAVVTHVGAGGVHGIARFLFTKAQVAQASKRLRHHMDLARVWSPAIGRHRSRRQTPHLIYSASPRGVMTPSHSD